MKLATMMVRSGVVLFVAAVISAAFSATVRAEEGRPSRDTLAAMGLGSMTVMSDEEGLAVRGHGYKGGSSVSVFGASFATINGPNGGAHSENGYQADGKHKAGGQNKSYAGVTISTSGGHKPGGGGSYGPKPRGNYGGGGGGYGGVKTTTIKYFAGGSSSGYAW
jgi:hypothetical protein